jgi:hypothetical protein
MRESSCSTPGGATPLLVSPWPRIRYSTSLCGGLNPECGSDEPTTPASVWGPRPRMRRRCARNSVVGEHDPVGSDVVPKALASLCAGSFT